MPYSCDSTKPTENFLSFLKQRLHLPLGTEWSTFSFHWPLCRVMCTTACQLNALTFIHSFIQVPTIFLCSVCTKCIRLLSSKSRVNRPPPVCPRSADETKSVWASVMLLHFYRYMYLSHLSCFYYYYYYYNSQDNRATTSEVD